MFFFKGKGSFGTTYLAERKEDGEEYCMKTVQLSELSPFFCFSFLNYSICTYSFFMFVF
jgi:hypothetical protein